ncbi:collectin-10-like isoform X2 [Lampetra fluviatilis]
MESGWLLLLLPLGLCSTEPPSRSSSACLSTFMLPGPNGDQGGKGDKGEQGLDGEHGAVGERGFAGEKGSKGIMGPYGKIGAVGEKGVKGELGGEGPIGPVGDPGSHCECGHLRRTVGELDIVISQLKNEVQLMKNVVGVSELGQKSYIVVKEGKSHADAASDCQHRGGTLAMPKDKATNDMLASFLSHRGVGAAYIGVRDRRDAADAGEGPAAARRFAYVDGGALVGGLARWGTGEPNDSGGAEGCVELTAAAGEWNDVDCEAPAYFVCEFERAAAE